MSSQHTVGPLSLPAVGIGCNAFGTRIDADRVVSIVDAAIELGVAFFDTVDTVDTYGTGQSEELLGQAIRGRRDDVIVATRFDMDMQGVNGDGDGRRWSATYVRTAVEASWGRLGVDHIDLYQLHTPDPATPSAETLGALDELVQAGTVGAIGCSNMQAWQVVDAAWTAKAAGGASFVTAQNEHSLHNRTAEVEVRPACLDLGVGILPYFPLAYGLLTGKYRRGERAPTGSRLEVRAGRLESADWDRVDQPEAFAARHDATILEVAVGGLAAQPAVASVIAGVTSAEQVASNAAAGSWTPTTDQLDELAGIGRPAMSCTTFVP